ncbi:MAG: class IV adenylate cyclase [Pirellulaceae bacterium]
MNGWEVEQKYHVADGNSLVQRLTEHGFVQMHTEQHADTYFRHPSRDFNARGEAFRLRLVDERACVTYKGPCIDAEVKTRPEIELSIVAAEESQWRIMFAHLGFQPVPTVTKTRRIFAPSAASSAWRNVVVALDQVEQLGEFAEVELLVQNRDELNLAQQRIAALSQRLGLDHIEPRSYLSQLLAKLGAE